MVRTINLGKTVTLEVQPKIETTTDKVELNSILDDGGCVMANFTAGEKKFSNFVLWDENTSPTYTEAGQYTDTDIDNRIKQLIN